MATLLSMLSNVAKAVGAHTPTAIIGSTDQTAQRLYQAMLRECRFLVRRLPWTCLIREATITTADGTASYPLESDFQRIIDDTAWDQTNYWQMRGSLSPQEWQFQKRAILAQPVNRRRYRIKYDTVSKAREVFIDPTPTSVATLSYEYVSLSYCQATGGGALKTEWSVDTDVPLFDDDLLELGTTWRYLKARGLPYADDQQEYQKALRRAIANDKPAAAVDLTRNVRGAFVLPDGNFTL